MKAFTCYRRVSTRVQGESGLGLEAQDAAMRRYAASIGATIIATFEDIESGANDDRPGWNAAVAHSRVHGSTILAAKQDRISRDLHFITGLQKKKIDFVCADDPDADEVRVHFNGLIGQWERRKISERTVAALAALKAQGKQLGNPNLGAGNAASRAGNAARSAKARAHAEMVLPYIAKARKAGATTLRALAEALDNLGVASPSGERGEGVWSHKAVARVHAQAAA